MRWLEIGPGKERLPGFETLNLVRTDITDHVGDAKKPPFSDATFELVYSSHCIEHVHWYEVEDTLAQWVRILKPGGLLEIFTLDALKLMKCVVVYEETGEWIGPDHYLTWRQKFVHEDPYKWAVGRMLSYPLNGRDYYHHRALITPGYLRRCFEKNGLIEIEPMTEERGHKYGYITFGLRGKKPDA